MIVSLFLTGAGNRVARIGLISSGFLCVKFCSLSVVMRLANQAFPFLFLYFHCKIVDLDFSFCISVGERGKCSLMQNCFYSRERAKHSTSVQKPTY